MTVAELRFRFNNKDRIDNWITNYIEYLENIALKIDTDSLCDKLNTFSNNDYIQYLENKIVGLTGDK